jgi:hypothetical protein
VAGVEQHAEQLRALDEEIERAGLQRLVRSETAGLAEIGLLLARIRGLRASREAGSACGATE